VEQGTHLPSAGSKLMIRRHNWDCFFYVKKNLHIKEGVSHPWETPSFILFTESQVMQIAIGADFSTLC
jgi:hypothetical protein